MSEEKATPAAAGTSATTRRTAATSRRRGTTKPTETTGPALPADRDDAFQAFPRVWPD
ncbi:MAG: hypothetical protein PVJ47_03220 [Thiohalocapsa sp.]|jgi:hypothetical protein